MGYQRDRRLDLIARAKAASCLACREIDCDGISFLEHTCGRAMLHAPRGAYDALTGGCP